jgi:hypothetical protein
MQLNVFQAWKIMCYVVTSGDSTYKWLLDVIVMLILSAILIIVLAGMRGSDGWAI